MGGIRNTKSEAEHTGRLPPVFTGPVGSAGIEFDEAQGQQELVHSELLPVDGSNDGDVLALGIVFGDPVPGDPLFRKATLPAGWKKRATDHSMWSEIVDEIGKVRAVVFYKAAFYDRSAFIRAERS